jgi:hypothetical protein
MKLDGLVGGIPDFAAWKHADKIRLFLWHVHKHGGKDWVKAADILACFAAVHEPPPANAGSFLEAMVKSGDALRESRRSARYKLAREARDRLEREWGQRAATTPSARLS